MEKDANIFSRQTDLQMNEFYSFRPCDYYLVAARILEESDREKDYDLGIPLNYALEFGWV